MKKTLINQQEEFAPTPNLNLTSKKGLQVLGILKRKVESKLFPGSFSYLIKVEETNAPTTLYNKEIKAPEEVDIVPGDSVWLKGTTVLNNAFSVIAEGTKIEVVYTGKGEAKPGRKPAYLFDVFQVEAD
jgi:hypothetical protein